MPKAQPKVRCNAMLLPISPLSDSPTNTFFELPILQRHDHIYVFRFVNLTTIQILEKIFNDLLNIEGIEASAIASRDGLLICSNLPQKRNAEAFAAMAATMFGAAEAATTVLGKGIPDKIIVESKHGRIIATGAGLRTLLLVMIEQNVALELILIKIAKVSERVKQVLD